MGMLKYILGCPKKIILKENVYLVVQNLNISLSALDEKLLENCHENVCNLHHIHEPLVAYIYFNLMPTGTAWYYKNQKHILA
jgi:hypothetical protein